MTLLDRSSALAQRVVAMCGLGASAWRSRKSRLAPMALARQQIDRAIDNTTDGPTLVRHWRSRQIGRALTHLSKGAYDEATAAALLAQLPAAQIPAEELSLEIKGALEEVRARREALTRIYGR